MPQFKSPSVSHAALVLSLALLAGCSGAYQRLASEEQSKEHVALKAAGARLPRETHHMPVRIADGQTIRVAVHELGAKDADRTIVLIHGVLSDSRMWRFLEGNLAADFRVVMVDLPGCGDSDKPDPATVPANFYGPCSLARCVLAAIDLRLRDDGGDRTVITLVSHSLGGMIVHRMFGNDRNRADFADVLERVDSIIAFAPPHVDIERVPAAFESVAKAGDLTFMIGDVTGILRDRVAQASLAGAPDPSVMFREDADRLVTILKDPRTRRAAQASLRAAVPNDGKRPDSVKARLIAAEYNKITVPTLIVWGTDDDTLGCSMGHKLRDDLPNACLRLVTHARHTVPVERPAISLALIRKFVTEEQCPADIDVKVARIDGRGGGLVPMDEAALARN
jgi:pimeloyl-ACP methyl ester carboxylesterase